MEALLSAAIVGPAFPTTLHLLRCDIGAKSILGTKLAEHFQTQRPGLVGCRKASGYLQYCQGRIRNGNEDYLDDRASRGFRARA